MSYKLQPGCTVQDADGIARNNVSAFWTQTWWRILFSSSEEALLEKVARRTPSNLLSQRDVRRHQVVIDASTGDIVGYARWILPATHGAEWIEAQVPALSDPDIARFKAILNETPLPFGENQDEMDALDQPCFCKATGARTQEAVSQYVLCRTWQHKIHIEGDSHTDMDSIALDYLATHPLHQRRGVSSMLVESGLQQADKLGIDVMVTAMGRSATSLYKKHGFELHWDLEQSLKPWGHNDVYYTAILIRRPVREK